MGPSLIFDKSVLQSLNPDEAVWLDQFYITNITPLFFVETLADLEKEVGKGRTPEEVVGNLAYKTPDLHSCSNAHHSSIIAAELLGLEEVDISFGRPIIPGGKSLELDGKVGVVFQPPPEAEAFERWQQGEFLDVERLFAKAWRSALSGVNYEQLYQSFQHNFVGGKKPKTFTEVKTLTDLMIDTPNQEQVLTLGLSMLGVTQNARERILVRWHKERSQSVRQFAPYFSYVLTVDLFFNLAIASDLISRGRPSHKIDMAYLYYLPFCMIFTSNDNLHINTVPLFLKPHQTFILGSDLKADLSKLDQFFSALPEKDKDRGPFHFAPYPPTDNSFLVTQLWDKHMSPTWRESQAKPRQPINKDGDPAVVKELGRLEKEGVPIDPSKRLNNDDIDSVLLKRMVRFKKGKWNRFPPEVKGSS